MSKLDKFKPRIPPAPPEQKRPIFKNLQIVVRSGAPIENAEIVLQNSVNNFEVAYTNKNGIVYFQDIIPYYLQSLPITIKKDGYKTIDKTLTLPIDRNVSIDIDLEREYPLAENLSILGEDFYSNNKLIRIQGITAFLTLQHYINGDMKSVIDIFDFARSINANTLRVLGECSWAGFNPKNISSYYDDLDEFFTVCASQGFYVLYNALATPDLHDSIESARLHVARSALIAQKHTNVLFTLANEPFKNLPFDSKVHDYATDLVGLSIFDYGASGLPKEPYEPTGTFTTEHSPRDEEWFRKSKHTEETQNVTGVPDIQAEPMGAISILGTGTSTQRDNNVQHFLEYFAVASLFGGSVFHSESLKFSRVPIDREFECALAARKGWNIPVEFMQGHYTAGHLSDCPLKNRDDIERMYFMIRGNKAIGVLVDPQPSFQIETKDGWRVDKITDGIILELSQ